MHLDFFSQIKNKKKNSSESRKGWGRLSDYDENLTRHCLVKLEALTLSKLAKKISVLWNPHMRSTAGRAYWPSARIELNPKLREISPEEIHQTLMHELAHLIAFSRNRFKKIAPHGEEWQQACNELGIPGEKATHSLPLPKTSQRKKWRYACPNCGDLIERVRKLKRASACYSCCKIYNKGLYHKKFELIESQID